MRREDRDELFHFALSILTIVGTIVGERLYRRHVDRKAEPAKTQEERTKMAQAGFAAVLGKITESERVETEQDIKLHCSDSYLQQLVDEMNDLGGVVDIDGKGTFKREDWVMKMLAKIPRRFRASLYPELNQILEDAVERSVRSGDPEAEILDGIRQVMNKLEKFHDDGLAQVAKQVYLALQHALKPAHARVRAARRRLIRERRAMNQPLFGVAAAPFHLRVPLAVPAVRVAHPRIIRRHVPLPYPTLRVITLHIGGPGFYIPVPFTTGRRLRAWLALR